MGASAAVDGNTDGDYWDGSVSHTDEGTNAWWQVDLGASSTIHTINIWNRTDCCNSRLSDYWVFVSDTPFNASDTPSTLQNRSGTWGSHQTSLPNPSTVIDTGGVQGRYIRVQLSGTNYLALAEVQVFTDLVAVQTATQSSTYPGNVGASAAVDGNTAGDYRDGSVSHTNDDMNAWWQVDLGASSMINMITVWNRTDCCSSRLSDYWVFVSDKPFNASDTPSTLQNRSGTWGSHQTTLPSPSTVIDTGGVQGRYIRKQLSGTNYLALAEVQVR
jgi:F5/8 type C domain